MCSCVRSAADEGESADRHCVRAADAEELAMTLLTVQGSWVRILGFMSMCAHVPEACSCPQEGMLAAVALCAADIQELEELGAAELCRGAEVAQQSADDGLMSPAAVEGAECLNCPCHRLQHIYWCLTLPQNVLPMRSSSCLCCQASCSVHEYRGCV